MSTVSVVRPCSLSPQFALNNVLFKRHRRTVHSKNLHKSVQAKINIFEKLNTLKIFLKNVDFLTFEIGRYLKSCKPPKLKFEIAKFSQFLSSHCRPPCLFQ